MDNENLSYIINLGPHYMDLPRWVGSSDFVVSKREEARVFDSQPYIIKYMLSRFRYINYEMEKFQK